MASSIDKSNTDSLKESVLMNIRSVTQSRKGGVPINCLERDYRDLLGTPIPFRNLGYNTLQAFLKDIPDVISLRHKDGQVIAEGVADSSTAHIVSLVNRQKTTKTIGKPGRRPYTVQRRGGISSRYSSRNTKYVSPKHSPSNSITREDRHSKSSQGASRETRPKNTKLQSPELVRAHKRYELAPRFQKQQQKKQTANHSELPVQRDFRPESPNQRPFRVDSPDYAKVEDFYSEPYSNNHIIKSPRPLLSTRTVVTKKDRLKDAATSKEYIDIYASMNNISYNYNTKLMGQKQKSFFSTLALGSKTYKSYPKFASTEEKAEELAAEAAVTAIKESQEHLSSCPETPIRNPEDVQILIDRIEEIVCEKPSGMFTNGIIHEYENKYNEILPENWLKLLQQSTNVEIEELDVPYGRVPEGVNHIVRRAKHSSGSTTPSSVSEMERAEYGYDDTGVPRNIVRKDHLPDIPELVIPPGNEWSVYIVDVSKTIAARLIDDDNLFLTMSEEMRTYYSAECLPAIEISEGLLYATCEADSDVFHRVLVQTIKENDIVECYFVDEGVFSEVPKSDLQELNSEFWKLPYQAIHLTLDGFGDYPLKPDDLNCLLGASLIAKVKSRGLLTVDYFPKDPAVHKKIYPVVLYNTNDEIDVDVNESIKDHVIESLVPEFPKPTFSSDGYYLSHVESTGEIYLRNLPFESWLETSLESLSPDFEKACLKKSSIQHSKICVAKYQEDGKWYRAKLVQNYSSANDPEKVDVFFVDYGNTSEVSTKEVCELEQLNSFLYGLTPQAIKCELYNPLPSPEAEWTPEAVTKLLELAPTNQGLIIRVIHEADESNFAQVNLYKRTEENDGDSFIISINECLANKPELFKFNSTAENSSLKLNFNDIRPPVPRTTPSNFNSIRTNDESYFMPIMPPSPANDLKWAITPDNIKSPDAFDDHDPLPLKLPEIPDIKELFDVFVTMAAHPHNFYVQPVKTMKEMNDLMTQMHKFYSSDEDFVEMHLSLLKENSFYAVKHNDGLWYRAQLQTVIHCDPVMVIVKYVDFGDLVTVNIQQLQPLYSKFRLLPCQAIKASLSGVKPIQKDWSAMQCVEFQVMIKEKKFVSIIQGTHFEDKLDMLVQSSLEDNLDIPVLELVLIDVSDPQKDIYIDKLLIENGIAAPV